MVLPNCNLNLTTGQSFTWSFQLQDTEGNPMNFPPGALLFLQFEINGVSSGNTITPPSGVSIWQFTVYGTNATITVPSSIVNEIPNGAPCQLVLLPYPIPIVDTVGSGFTGTTTPTITQNISGSGLLVFADVADLAGSTVTAQIAGTTNIPELSGSPIANYTGAASLHVFGLIGPPIGSQTITLTPQGSSYNVAAQSISYLNAASFGTIATAVGSGNASMTVPSEVGQTVAQAFGGFTTTFANYSQHQYWNTPAANPTNVSFVLGSGPGANITPFSVTGSQAWAGIGVPILSSGAYSTTGFVISLGTAVVTA